MEQYFTAPEQFYGKNIGDVRRSLSGDVPFEPSLVASALGISPESRFGAGQNFNVSGLNPGSAELQFLQKYFQPGKSPNQQAVEPAIQTLQAQKAPLQQRYQDLLKSIKARETQEVQQTDVNAARELGRRGIPLSSTFSGEFQQQRRLPVETAFGQLEAETGLSAEQQQLQLAQAIAQLQAGAGQSDVLRQLELAKLAAGERESAANRSLQEKLATLSGKQESPFTTLSEGTTLFNLLTGQPIYTAPKTYKPESGSGASNDPLGLF